MGRTDGQGYDGLARGRHTISPVLLCVIDGWAPSEFQVNWGYKGNPIACYGFIDFGSDVVAKCFGRIGGGYWNQYRRPAGLGLCVILWPVIGHDEVSFRRLLKKLTESSGMRRGRESTIILHFDHGGYADTSDWLEVNCNWDEMRRNLLIGSIWEERKGDLLESDELVNLRGIFRNSWNKKGRRCRRRCRRVVTLS